MIALNYTTCTTCKEILALTYVGQETHPTCESTPTEKNARDFVDAIQRGDEPEIIRLEKLVNQPSLPKLGSSALWYAKQGWAIFPLLPNSKQPATKNGFYDATMDLSKIKAWWDRHPDSNIGLPTGGRFDVIDIDGPTGIASLHELGEGVIPEIHGKVSTPNGFHMFVAAAGDGNRAGVRPGIDYRGVGGYVVAPPSQIDLRRYTWLIQPSPVIMGSAA